MDGIIFVVFYFGLFYLTVTAKDQIMSYPEFDDMIESTLLPYLYDEIDPDTLEDAWDDDYDESMDGDHDSAMESAGWGTDEDYGYYGEDYQGVAPPNRRTHST